jgi:queuosine precursor transporter
MHDNLIESKVIRSQPNYLWFLTLTYAMVIVLANWFDPRLINILGLDTDAGTLIFPFTFLLSDLITEVYGFKYARRAIWCGFLFNAIFIVYGQIVIHMPSPNYPTNNDIFDSILATNIRIIIASGISYIISEPLNSMIMAKLKIKMEGRYLGVRFVSSTIIASGTDSLLFGLIAFYGMMSNSNLLSLILSMWFIKVFIEILGLPISIRLAKKLKRLEQLDIYDKKTNFNVFSLDTHYTDRDNEFYKKNGNNN